MNEVTKETVKPVQPVTTPAAAPAPTPVEFVQNEGDVKPV